MTVYFKNMTAAEVQAALASCSFEQVQELLSFCPAQGQIFAALRRKYLALKGQRDRLFEAEASALIKGLMGLSAQDGHRAVDALLDPFLEKWGIEWDIDREVSIPCQGTTWHICWDWSEWNKSSTPNPEGVETLDLVVWNMTTWRSRREIKFPSKLEGNRRVAL